MAKQLGIRQLPIFQFHHMKNFFTISSNCADISEKSQFRLSVFAHIKLPLMLNASLMEGCSGHVTALRGMIFYICKHLIKMA